MICAVVERSPPPVSMPMEFFWSADEIDLPDNFVFARTSHGTLIDDTGKLTFGPNNIITRSNTFDHADWDSLSAKGTLTLTSGQSDPFGGTDAWKMVNPNGDRKYLSRTISFPTNTRIIWSVYAKAGPSSFGTNFQMKFDGIGVGMAASTTFNLQAGTKEDTDTAHLISSTMEDLGSGWYRCSILGDTGDHTTTSPIMWDWVNGDGTNGITIYACKFEFVTYQTTPSSRLPFTTSAPYYGGRIDYTNGVAEFLLEKSRQNRLTYSEDLTNGAWSISGLARSNNVTAIDGLANKAATLTANTSANICILYQDISGASGTNAHSVYAKKGTSNFVFITIQGTVAENCIAAVFNLDAGTVTSTYEGATTGTVLDTQIEHIGNGVYRCSLVGSSNAANYFQVGISPSATPSYDSNGRPTSAGFAGTETIIVQKPQCEAGNFTSSYMPTFASAFTRAAETCYTADSGMTNGAGTIIVECVTPPVDQFGCILSVYDVGGGAISDIFKSNSSVGDVGHVPMVFDNSDGGGGAYEGDDSVNMNSGEAVRIAVRRKLDGILDDHRLAISVNGNAPNTIGSFTPDDLSPPGISLSQRYGGGFPMDVRIRRIAFTTQTLSDADLQLASTLGIGFTWTPDMIDWDAWFDGSDSSTITIGQSTSYIVQWDDKSGNDNHVYNNANNAHNPVVAVAAQNGLNAVNMDSSVTGVMLYLTETLDYSTSGYSVFAVMDRGTVGFGRSGDLGACPWWVESDGTIVFATQSGSHDQTLQNPKAVTGFHQITCVFNPAPSALCRFDGEVLSTTHDQPWSGRTPFPLNNIGEVSQPFDIHGYGTLCEIMVIPGALSPSEIYMVEKYLKAKWGTP